MGSKLRVGAGVIDSGVEKRVHNLRNYIVGEGVSDISVAGGVITFTTRIAHGLSASDAVWIEDVTGTISPSMSQLSQWTVATTPTSTTFTLSGTFTGAWSEGPSPASAPTKRGTVYTPTTAFMSATGLECLQSSKLDSLGNAIGLLAIG